jgi:hypothetical protein
VKTGVRASTGDVVGRPRRRRTARSGRHPAVAGPHRPLRHGDRRAGPHRTAECHSLAGQRGPQPSWHLSGGRGDARPYLGLSRHAPRRARRAATPPAEPFFPGPPPARWPLPKAATMFASCR